MHFVICISFINANFIKYTNPEDERLGQAAYIKLILDHYSKSTQTVCDYSVENYEKEPTNLYKHQTFNARSSFPLLTSFTLRAAADWVIDDGEYGARKSHLILSEMKHGDVVFVFTPLLSLFFEKIHPLIPIAYVLVTHNSPKTPPTTLNIKLDDPKVLAWFAENPNEESINHPKLYTIPLGLANLSLPNGRLDEGMLIFSRVHTSPFYGYEKEGGRMRGGLWKEGKETLKKDTINNQNNIRNLRNQSAFEIYRVNHLYSNLRISTNAPHRKRALESIESLKKEKPYLKVQSLIVTEKYAWPLADKTFYQYLRDLRSSRYVASPLGTGNDCFRTWEAYLCGAVPIVHSSPLNSLYEAAGGFVVLRDWDELKTAVNFSSAEHYKDVVASRTEFGDYVMKADFWINLMRAFKKCK